MMSRIRTDDSLFNEPSLVCPQHIESCGIGKVCRLDRKETSLLRSFLFGNHQPMIRLNNEWKSDEQSRQGQSIADWKVDRVLTDHEQAIINTMVNIHKIIFVLTLAMTCRFALSYLLCTYIILSIV